MNERKLDEIMKLFVAPMTEEKQKALDDAKKRARAKYGENKKITDGNFDKSLATKCINGTFVGRKCENIIT